MQAIKWCLQQHVACPSVLFQWHQSDCSFQAPANHVWLDRYLNMQGMEGMISLGRYDGWYMVWWAEGPVSLLWDTNTSLQAMYNFLLGQMCRNVCIFIIFLIPLNPSAIEPDINMLVPRWGLALRIGMERWFIEVEGTDYCNRSSFRAL